MLRPQNNLPLLVVDPDPLFLKQIQTESKASTIAPVVARTRAEAQNCLSDSQRDFSAVFVNPRVSESTGLSVVRCAHQYRMGTPVFLICEGKNPYTPAQLERLAIQDVVHKPLSYRDLIRLVAPILKTFDAAAAIALAKHGDERLDSEIAAADAEFTPIRAENFISGKKSFFSVYIRLTSGKYLKLLEAGHSFEWEKLMHYIKKGVTHFYLRKEVQRSYLAYCDHLASQLVTNAEATPAIKVGQVLNHGEVAAQSIRDLGIESFKLEYAAQFVKNAQRLLAQLKLEGSDGLKTLVKSVGEYEHGVSTVMIAGLLTQSMKVESERLVNMIGLSALLHDVGLLTMPELEPFAHGNEDKMTDEQRARYQTHPMVGADLLRGVPNLDLAIIQAVAQHHERRDRSGFPNRVGPTKISRIAEIVGLSDEFARHLGGPNPFQEMSQSAFDGFSPSLVDAFCLVFLRKM